MADWDRQPGEPVMWFARFRDFYLPLGPERTIEEAYRLWFKSKAGAVKSKRPSQHWYEAVREWRWHERAVRWDDVQRDKAYSAMEDEQVKALKRHISTAMLLQQAALRRLQQIINDPGDKEAGRPPLLETLTPDQVLRFIDRAIEIERKARGLPSEVLELMGLTNDELQRRYETLLSSLARVGGVGSGDEDEGSEAAGNSLRYDDDAEGFDG